METLTIMWLIFMATLLIGGALGYLFCKRFSSAHKRCVQLEQQLKSTQESLSQYRSQVTKHFSHTAELVHNMTASYQAVFDHLATGAETFCDKSPDGRRLFLQQEAKVLSFDRLRGSNLSPTVSQVKKPLDMSQTDESHRHPQETV